MEFITVTVESVKTCPRWMLEPSDHSRHQRLTVTRPPSFKHKQSPNLYILTVTHLITYKLDDAGFSINLDTN